MELEEYGLPRMLAKKIHAAGLVNFEDEKLGLHSTIDLLRNHDSSRYATLTTCSDASQFTGWLQVVRFSDTRRFTA